MSARSASSRRNQMLMFGVMLVAAIGNTRLQSILPATGLHRRRWRDERAALAGYVTAINGGAFALGPTIGILLYGVARPLPYWVAAALMAMLLIHGWRRLRS